MATLAEYLTAASRLGALEEERAAIVEAVPFDAPLLDKWAAVLWTFGPLRKRDGLTVTANRSRSWRFTPHSSGAYLDGSVGLTVDRNGAAPAVGVARLRYSVTFDGGRVNCPTWEANDGTLRTFTVHAEGLALPAAAHDLVADHLRDTWRGLAVDVVEVWAECLAYHVGGLVHDVARGKVPAYHVARVVAQYGEAVTA